MAVSASSLSTYVLGAEITSGAEVSAGVDGPVGGASSPRDRSDVVVAWQGASRP